MTNSKSTKRSLLTSSISLLLSFAMLLGTTFAWFTDSASTGVNKIQSGNLDIEVFYATQSDVVNGEIPDANWKVVDKDTPVFNPDALWEPGYTEVVYFKIENAGSLALRYIMSANIASETAGINKDGNEFNLSDYLSAYYMTGDEATILAARDKAQSVDGWASMIPDLAPATLAEAVSMETGKAKALSYEYELKSDETAYTTMVIFMPTTVGNEANHKTGEQAPSIDLGINFVATQYTYEKDSYDDQYDEDAEYPFAFDTIDVDSATTFTDISTLLSEGKSIRATEDITIMNPAGGNTELFIDDNVHIIADNDAVITFGETTLIKGDGTLTVHSGNLKTNYELCVTGDSTMVIEGGTHSFGAFSATSNGKIVVNGGTLNCRGTYAGVMGISFAENGQLIVNGGNLNMYQPFNLNANRCDDAYIEINGGRIELLNGIENLFVVRNIMEKDNTSGVLRGSSIRVNGGTFIANYPVDSAGDATSFIRNGDSPADTNKVLVSNTFNGVPDYNCKVTGGAFFGSWQRADNQRYTAGNGGYSDGLFVENSIAGFVADGYQITGDSANGYVVSAK